MFKTIRNIDDVRPFVVAKKEIRFQPQPNGSTVGCYLFMDSGTFDSAEALECRGIAFDAHGAICSRPLHKFFNAGEKDWLTVDALRARTDLAAIFEKLDGSMIATAWLDGTLHWRSKKSFSSDVVRLTESFVALPENAELLAFATKVASQGLTAIFELTHPLARIVVAPDKPRLRLLHVRDNVTGEYVLLDPTHPVHGWALEHSVPRVPMYDGMSFSQMLDSLETMTEQEGYVLQFANGDMVKLKCPWYARLHRSVTFLRERDIAVSSLNEELDDLKAVLAEAGVDLAPVEEVEHRLKSRLVQILDDIDVAMRATQGMDRKSFALANSGHPLFGLMMAQFLGKEVDVKGWFLKNRLKDEFSLRVLADGALADALEG